MITKRIYPEVEPTNDRLGKVTTVTIEYRLFGILLYKKILETPFKHSVGLDSYTDYVFRF